MWDEETKPKAAPALGADLSRIGVEELEERLRQLDAEIARVRLALQDRRRLADAAAATFKR
ncbi:MAG: DUF1192 family protein [Hyphomicrobiales bacterium]|nr:DUF1192 family protein [Hyphomicrobiales bacterium]